MSNYFISYEWDIAIISSLVTLLVVAIAIKSKSLLSEWWFVIGKNKKFELFEKVKQKVFHFLLDINDKYNLGLYIAERNYMFVTYYPYVNRIDFKLPENRRYDTMECTLYLSDSPKGTNPNDERTLRIFLTLKTYEWDELRDKLNKIYEEAQNS